MSEETAHNLPQDGVRQILARLDSIDSRLDNIEGRAPNVEGNLSRLEDKLDRFFLEERLAWEKVLARLNSLEGKWKTR